MLSRYFAAVPSKYIGEYAAKSGYSGTQYSAGGNGYIYLIKDAERGNLSADAVRSDITAESDSDFIAEIEKNGMIELDERPSESKIETIAAQVERDNTIPVYLDGVDKLGEVLLVYANEEDVTRNMVKTDINSYYDGVMPERGVSLSENTDRHYDEDTIEISERPSVYDADSLCADGGVDYEGDRAVILNYIKHGVKISPDAKEAIISAVGENSARGYIAMMSNNSALGIDSVYDELSVALPGYFTSDALTEGEKMRRVIDVYTWLKDGKSMQDVKLIDVMTPDDALTEAEFAALISRVLNIDVGTEGEHWYDSAIFALKKLGISDNETDNPESAIPREDVCAMAVRAYEYKKGAAPTKAVEYTDKDSISGDKLVFAEKALWLNLMSGDTMNSFMPKNSITRAEAEKVIQRLSYILS